MSKLARWEIRFFFIAWMAYLWFFGRRPFEFLLLNTFLGYLPIEISFHINNDKPKSLILFWLAIILWILFYPNAPYVLTDLFHLSLLNPYSASGLLRSNPQMWYEYTCLLISALSCAILGFWSLLHISKVLKSKFNLHSQISQFLIAVTLMTSASIGIYIGRMMRIHTIYLFIRPQKYIMPLLTMWNKNMIMFVCLITIIQILIYWLEVLIIKDGVNQFANENKSINASEYIDENKNIRTNKYKDRYKYK